jgi:hypothetical protein
MPTIPRRWPSEVEPEREQAVQAASEAALCLQEAQGKMDSARGKVHSNQSLATILLADSDRLVADAMTRMERMLRFMAIAGARPLNSRWPMGVVRQRDDAHTAGELALDLLLKAQFSLGQAREKAISNPSLAEAIIADSASLQARALTQAERIARLLTEAGIGRD